MISEEKKKIVIENYFKDECDINTSIKEAYIKGFERGLSKAIDYSWVSVDTDLPTEDGWYQCTVFGDNFHYVMDLYFYTKNQKWIDNRRVDVIHTYDVYGWGLKAYWEPDMPKHKLTTDEVDGVDWTGCVVAWKPLPKPYEMWENK